MADKCAGTVCATYLGMTELEQMILDIASEIMRYKRQQELECSKERALAIIDLEARLKRLLEIGRTQ